MQTGNLEIKKMKCLVVDDEVVARKGIIRELQKNMHIDIVGEANSVETFQKIIDNASTRFGFFRHNALR